MKCPTEKGLTTGQLATKAQRPLSLNNKLIYSNTSSNKFLPSWLSPLNLAWRVLCSNPRFCRNILLHQQVTKTKTCGTWEKEGRDSWTLHLLIAGWSLFYSQYAFMALLCSTPSSMRIRQACFPSWRTLITAIPKYGKDLLTQFTSWYQVLKHWPWCKF